MTGLKQVFKAWRRKLRAAPWVQGPVAAAIAGWLRLSRATTRWRYWGVDDLLAAQADGPIILVLWHEVTLYGVSLWPKAAGGLSPLSNGSPVGDLSAEVQRRLGLSPVRMLSRESNVVGSRQVLRILKQGGNIGIAADGPSGPVHVMKDAALDWARISGRPIFLFAAQSSRQRRVNSWDRMVFPMPFGRGDVVYLRYPTALDRQATAEDIAAVRDDMTARLTALTADPAGAWQRSRPDELGPLARNDKDR